jgi:hypothetical protein
MKTRLAAFVAGFFLFVAGGAVALVGTPPNPFGGFAPIDQAWVLGVANGQNSSFQSGLTATGNSQATALQIAASIGLIEVDTVASGTGIALPACVAGTELSVYNNGANTLTVYPSILNNGLTGAQDTISRATTLTGGMATNTTNYFFCAKNGNWAAK